MEHIGKVLEERVEIFTKNEKITSERQSVVSEFVDRINKNRAETGYKPMKSSKIAVSMAHLDLWDLRIFLGRCKEAKNFSAYWWYNLKVK